MFHQSHVCKLIINELLKSIGVIDRVIETLEGNLFIDAKPENPVDLEKACQGVVIKKQMGYLSLIK